MDKTTLKAAARSRTGTRYARREREAGRIPAIIYGHGKEPEAVCLSAHDVEGELAHGTRVLHLDVDGREGQYLIKEVQYDYRGTVPVHLDLMRVDLDERVTVSVEVELRGTPKGVTDGGVLDQLLTEVEVECVVTQIPDTFRPVVTGLEVGQSLTVADLDVPPGVTIKRNLEDKVATVRMLVAEPEPEQVVAEEEETQPEVIGRGREEQAQE
jgi:large subunit ribosomal protein L25